MILNTFYVMTFLKKIGITVTQWTKKKFHNLLMEEQWGKSWFISSLAILHVAHFEREYLFPDFEGNYYFYFVHNIVKIKSFNFSSEIWILECGLV